MKLSGAVYRHVLELALNGAQSKFTENAIARRLHISPNTVSIAINALSNINAATIYERHFEIKNVEKALYFWAAERKLKKDIGYSTYAKLPVAEIEKRMPNEVAFTAYSCYKNLFGNDVSDYAEVYVYATPKACEEIMHRFPKQKLSKLSDYANIIVLNPDKVLKEQIESKRVKHASVSVLQAYVDTWNLQEWYASRFEEKFRQRISEMHGKKLLQ